VLRAAAAQTRFEPKEPPMKRLHVSLAVENLDDSIRFYSGLFAAEPSVRKADYAKWMLDDPRLNFSLTARGAKAGVDHLGFQAESEAELSEIRARLRASEGAIADEGAVTCCYHKSEKSWVFDPQGVAWEAFLTQGESEEFGEATLPAAAKTSIKSAACCRPEDATDVLTKDCCGQAQIPAAYCES
jgi:catechol 2,3-dioxygenase-like lactoylglutathione lyase family enzyme